MLTRSSWWQQQLIPRRLREDLVVMALLHRLLEIRQSQPAKGAGTESAKDKRNERSSLVMRRVKPLRGDCALPRVLGCGGSTRGSARTGEWSPAGGKGSYLPWSIQPGTYIAPSPAFCPVFLALTDQWSNWWRICLLSPWWCPQGTLPLFLLLISYRDFVL